MRLIVLLSLLAAIHGLSFSAGPSAARVATSARRCGGVSLAGFGNSPAAKQGAGKGKKAGGFGAAAVQKQEISKKAMASSYQRLTELEDALAIDVYARVDPAKATNYPGSSTEPPEHGDDWLHVGRIAVAKPATLQQAAQHQKRLVLEHASAISKRLRLQSKDLVVGLQTPYSVSHGSPPSRLRLLPLPATPLSVARPLLYLPSPKRLKTPHMETIT